MTAPKVSAKARATAALTRSMDVDRAKEVRAKRLLGIAPPLVQPRFDLLSIKRSDLGASDLDGVRFAEQLVLRARNLEAARRCLGAQKLWEEGGDEHWYFVQCSSCAKWRFVPLQVSLTQEQVEAWTCELNVHDRTHIVCAHSVEIGAEADID
jgi:hypothetical protein